jgi:ABC-type phosphate/phosphonate transport system substrate-binding protein
VNFARYVQGAPIFGFFRARGSYFMDAFVASLGMYDFPFIAEANGQLWTAIGGNLRAAGIEAPEALDGADPHVLWTNPGLIFGQTCGYPYVTQLKGDVVLLATPTYAFDGCEGAAHCSFVVTHARSAKRNLASFEGARGAINALDSNTGMNLFRDLLAPIARGRPFFTEVIRTGSHAASLAAIVEGTADIAAVDSVTYGLLRRGRPELLEDIAIIARTKSSPCLPFIMNAGLGESLRAAVRVALFAALRDSALVDARAALGLTGAALLDDSDYRIVTEIEHSALTLGYPALA